MTAVDSQHASDLAALFDMLTGARSGWRGAAACSPVEDRTIFWSRQRRKIVASRAICATCPVVADCATFGADQDDGSPVRWAGHTARTLRGWRDRHSAEWQNLAEGHLPTTDEGNADA